MRRHLDDLKQQIEQVLRWEQSSHWRPRDFETLSHLVVTYTNRHVEARDLQAFWQSSSIPSQFILDTLATFTDYKDWEDFCNRNSYGAIETDDETGLLHAPMWEIPMRWVVIICWLSIIASVLVAALLVWKR